MGAETSKTKAFRLLDLPDELWVKIGKLSIDNAPTLSIKSMLDDDLSIPPQPAITRTCTALRHELLPYYYKHNIDICVEELGVKDYLTCWLSRIGADNRALIHGIYFHTTDRLVYLWQGFLEREWKVKVELKLLEEKDEKFLGSEDAGRYGVIFRS